MQYPLESYSTFEQNLLCWMGRFVRWKINTLSNHQVRDKEAILQCLKALHTAPHTIQELLFLCKKARNAGLVGINLFSTPLHKLYEYLTSLQLDSLTRIDEELLVDFLSVYTSKLSDASKKNYRIVLIGFFGYIDKHNTYNQGSFVFGIKLAIRHIVSQASGQKLPTYLDENELERFLEAIDTTPLPIHRMARDRLIIKVIIYTGMRVSEALSLRTKDLIPQHDIWMFQIRGKGNKMRVAMIKKENTRAVSILKYMGGNSMGSRTKIIVLHMKEIIYTAIFAALGILLIILLVIMFRPGGESGQKNTEQQYTPGTYTSSLMLNNTNLEVEVSVDEDRISSIRFSNLDDTVQAMFPLLQPAIEDIAEQVYETQSLDDITLSDETPYTSQVILDAIKEAVNKAAVE